MMQCSLLKCTFKNLLTQFCNLKDQLIQFQPTVVQIPFKLSFFNIIFVYTKAYFFLKILK